jgi:putative ABC transport system permease protein
MPAVETMIHDLRYAIRVLRRNRLTAVAVCMLGIGIGGITVMFSVVDAVLLRPLPFRHADNLVRIWELTREGDRFSFSDPTYLDLQAEARSLESVAAFRETGAGQVLTGGTEPERVTAVPVSASFFAVFGVEPLLGRSFEANDDRPVRSGPGAERVAVLSDALWRRQFGADAAVIGRVVLLDDEPTRIRGVMPRGFDFPADTDLWVPLGADARRDRTDKELAVIGRLARGATLEQAREELRAFARRTAAAWPQSNAGWSATAIPFFEWLVTPRLRDAVWVLFGAVAFLLVLACANVANLLIAHAATRRAELQVRSALGGARRRLVRQLLTEAAILALLGTGVGLIVAFWSTDAVRLLGGAHIPRLDALRIDGTVLAFACAAGAASCLLFGVAPALHATRLGAAAMLGGTRVAGGSSRTRAGLVVVEVGLAVVLLASAGLMANSFMRLVNVDAGFTDSGLVAIPLDLPQSRYADARRRAFHAEVLDRTRALPGVVAAGATSTNPFRELGFSNDVTPEDRAANAPPSGLVQAGWRSVTPGFFEAMGIRLIAGRVFEPRDRDGSERVVVISDSLARRLWPNQPAVGRRVYWGGTTGRTRLVIGVTADIRDTRLEAVPPPMLFVPYEQVDPPKMTLVVRSRPDAPPIGPAFRTMLADMDAGLPPPAVEPVSASRAASSGRERFNLALLVAFAAIGLALAASGIYAMLAFTVAERRREIGVRVALGADHRTIARMVLREGLVVSLAGITAGCVAALAVTRVLEGLLFEVDPADPITFAIVTAGLLLVALLACYLPARQATQVDPITVLRVE